MMYSRSKPLCSACRLSIWRTTRRTSAFRSTSAGAWHSGIWCFCAIGALGPIAHDRPVNRGAYLATALGGCAECNAPRNLAYERDSSREFGRCCKAGTPIILLPRSALASAPGRRHSLPAFSPPPTRKAATPPPDPWQKQCRTACKRARRCGRRATPTFT